MSKEQKTLKSCYILDRLREWFELYGNQNHQRAEEELHLAIDELYEYQQKDQQISDLEAKLAEKDEQLEYFSKRDDEQEKQLEKQALFHRKSIKELKQQLAEKEKEIEGLKAQRHIYLNRSVEECNKITDLEFELQHKDQDKISFAVDVLKIAQDYVQQYVNDFDDKNDCLCAIDKQIKQLTHQHEDKGE